MADCCTDVSMAGGWTARLRRGLGALFSIRLAPPLSDEQAKLLATIKLPCC